ncbi:MAG: 30S ribosomal protein S6 [Cyanobacteria bacterium P01_H01_bin.74]
MNTYEILVIVKPSLENDNADNLAKTFESMLTSLQGKIIKKDKMGRKRLAYEIKKMRDGFFASYVVQLAADKLDKLKRACNMNETILRLMIVKHKVDITNPIVYGREKNAQDNRGGGGPSGGEPRRRQATTARPAS